MRTSTAVTVPTQFVEANGIRFAYRRFGKQGGFRSSFTSILLATSITGTRPSPMVSPRSTR